MHEVTAKQALIVNFRDTPAVTGALARIAEDQKLRTRLREGGLVRAKDFTFEKFTSERINVIQRLVSALRSRREFKV
jgi:glycosyltransferase involved in cell wall biosynthesis